MRIIAGNRRGHKLVEIEGDSIRPTTDRVKESVFNLIQGYVLDANVLDLFAGSGALGLEALSRGAKFAVFTDKAKSSCDVVKSNVESLKFGDVCKVINTDYESFFARSKEKFDIIFLDPPYNKGFIEPVLSDIAKNERLTDSGIVVLESYESDMHDEIDGLTVIKQKKYGRSYVTVYQRG